MHNHPSDAIWFSQYSKDVPRHIDISEFKSLLDIVDPSLAQYAALPAYQSFGVNLSYQQLDQESLNFAAWLHHVGVRPGDRVALMMPNVLQYPITLFGTLRAGAVVVNCNPLYTPTELEHQLVDSGATVIVVLENFANTVQAVLAKTKIKQVIVTPMGECLGLKGHLVNLVVRKVKKLVPAWNIPSAQKLKAVLATGAANRQAFDASAVKKTLSHDSIAFLQYTGGTTGVAKGAVLTHGNMLANLTQARKWVAPLVNPQGEVVITALPLYHIFSLTANCLVFLQFGANNILIANPRDIPGFVKTLKSVPFSVMSGVNTLFNALLNDPDFSKLDFSHLKITLGGGMAVQTAVADRWRKVTGCTLAQAYGLTETSPAVTINLLDKNEFTGSIGLPISSTELVIRADDGSDVAQGEIGEICVRGPQVMKEYWNRPDETAKVFHADRFLKTGDMGYIDDKGFVFIVDRKKDMVIVSGFNVYPNEVEEVIAQHPGVLEVAVVGVSDEHSGEVVKAFIVKKDPHLTEEAVISHCKTVLTGYKIPKHIAFRSELPKTNVGKILRRALRDSK